MNYHSDKWIMERLQEHYNEALEHFPEEHIVGIFIQGSQNYGLDYEGSDIDTKLIIAPTFEEIAFNKSPVSTTHVRANNEHIDFKDIRLYIETFRKQNLNFLEILFTPYKIINPLYEYEWEQLELHREEIARYDLKRAVHAMRGVAMEKYHAMHHRYPSKVDIIDKYGYDPKQLHHLLRVEDYLERYIDGEAYIKCLQPTDAGYLLDVKTCPFDLESADKIADRAIAHINEMCANFVDNYTGEINTKVDIVLNEVQFSIMKKAIKLDFDKE